MSQGCGDAFRVFRGYSSEYKCGGKVTSTLYCWDITGDKVRGKFKNQSTEAEKTLRRWDEVLHLDEREHAIMRYITVTSAVLLRFGDGTG